VRALVGKELLHNPPEPLRLYTKREALKDKLLATIANDAGAMERMMATLSIPQGLKV